ncbi:MAG: hypothetical protein ACTSP2_03710, partial [Alphaproteobacteria bacterium]
MAEGEKNKGATGASGRKRARAQRKPVTIDLAASATPDKPAAARKPAATRRKAAGPAQQPSPQPTSSPPEPPPEPPTAPEPPPAPQPPPTLAPPLLREQTPNTRALALAGIAGGVVVLIFLLVLQGLGWWPA